MRFFPSASRQHLLTASVAGAVMLGAVAIPFAHADDDLDARQEQVEGQIESAEGDLHEASQAVTRATNRLVRAKAQLADARVQLDDVRERLGVAQDRERRTRLELTVAQVQLRLAGSELEAGRVAVEDQRVAVTTTVRDIYTKGDPRLLALGSLMESETLEDVTRRMAADDAVVGRGTRTFDDLTDAEDVLAERQVEVADMAEVVSAKQRSAKADLVSIEGLVTEAETAEARVADLVADGATARTVAIRAKRADQAMLERLKVREERIRQEILARSANATGGFRGNSGGFLAYPTNGPVTSPYGYRTHPIYGYYSLHNGTDFGVACGQDLYASAAGTVVDTYYDDVYGNRLFLDVGQVNGKNLTLVYNHLTSSALGEGARVARGGVVGYAGSTGWSTGCHLHFTVLENGTAVDPMNYL